MSLLNRKLESYLEQQMYSFHTPGHKGRIDLFSEFSFPGFDLTELPGLDMLHNPQGIIAEAQKRAAAVYGADETFFLVNGGTSGNQAMLFSLMSNISGKKIRIERKAHRSVIGGLILSGLTPEYIYPQIHPDFNLPLGLDSKRFLTDIQETGALHLTYPSYYGTTPDLEYIIKQRDEEFSYLPVLVDQAHGAHFLGKLFPQGAVRLGADAVIHSTHKTLAALTQAGMLHVQGIRIDRSSLRKSLEILQTSSPSYLLLASLEGAVTHLEQREIWQDLFEEVQVLHERLDGKLRLLTLKDAGKYGIKEVDWTKILINISNLEVTTAQAVGILRMDYRIEPELWDKENILFMLGTGNSPEDIRHLTKALEDLVINYSIEDAGYISQQRRSQRLEQLSAPIIHLTPREAWLGPKREVKVHESLGLIAGETISIYPPGIPLVALGEEITPVVIDYLQRATEFSWQGWEGFNRGKILVIDV